jgi:aspartyl aminopeptidase
VIHDRKGYAMHTSPIASESRDASDTNDALFSYIAACPTAFHTVAHTAALLKEAGYTALPEGEDWTLTPGGRYYVTRNGSSLIAFRVPRRGDFGGFMMAAAHGDAPTFKVKENAEITDQQYVRLSVEKYGGMLCATWMDRPLGVAGRVTVRLPGGLETRLVDLSRGAGETSCIQALIPSVAIHLNRSANDKASYNPAVDMIPLAGTAAQAGAWQKALAQAAAVPAEDILTSDLYLYNPQPGVAWGGLISAPRLDDLLCAFCILSGFLASDGDSPYADMTPAGPQAVPVLCLFDNEEVGSQTRQGAASTFLWDVLCRLADCLGISPSGLRRRLASSFMLSCDNGHAVHPNHPELSDRNHTVSLGGGVVIKYNANQRYTSDALSAALFQTICEKAGVPFQRYANRADMPGGSTLGNISGTQVSVPTADIGLAQLAMHSAFETAGADDTGYMIRALTAFYRHAICMTGDGKYTVTWADTH